MSTPDQQHGFTQTSTVARDITRYEKVIRTANIKAD